MADTKRICRVYGRHRHRVVTVDIWSDESKRDKDVFSISSDSSSNSSNLYHSMVHTIPTMQSIGSCQKKTQNRRNPTSNRNQAKKKLQLKSSQNKTPSDFKETIPSPGLFDSGEWKQVLRCYDSNIQHTVPNKKTKTEAAHKKTTSKALKSCQKDGSGIREQSKTRKDSMEFSQDFSQFDAYDLIIDSTPQIITVTKEQSGDSHHWISTLHSTPHTKNLKSVLCLKRNLDEKENTANGTSLSDVSKISFEESTTVSSGDFGQKSKTGKQNLTDEISGKKIDIGSDSNGKGKLDMSQLTSLNPQDQLHDTGEYDASASLFDDSFVVGKKVNPGTMKPTGETENMAASSKIISLDDSELDTTVLSDIPEDDFDKSKWNFQSPKTSSTEQQCSSTNTCSSNADIDNICNAASSVQQGNSSFSNKSQPNNMISVLTHSLSRNSVHLHTPLRQRPRKDDVETPYLSAERSRELVDEILKSRKSLQLLLTPLKISKFFTAESKILFLCKQREPMTFSQCIPPKVMQKCAKIGEGVYGEVFMSEVNKEPIALKIIPIEGDFLVNGEQQKTFEEVLPEIIITQELSSLQNTGYNQTPNFVNIRKISVVKGAYPQKLLKQWDIFNDTKGSENDRPDMYTEDQLFIVFEFDNCGTDLSSFQLSNVQQMKSIFHQLVASLAIAEEALQFEHRDLHWGNVLVKNTKIKAFNYMLQGKAFKIISHGVKVSIIDFTLSRLYKDGCNIFTDLSTDPTLFEGQGDFQFDVYRLMKEVNGNEWEHFEPFTNILWIKYILDKLLNATRCLKRKAKHAQAITRQLRTVLEDVMNYIDARHMLKECPSLRSYVQTSS